MYKLVIFDFDGVLADSFEHVYDINMRAAAHVNKTLTRDQYKKLFYGSFHKALFAELNMSPTDEEAFSTYKYEIYEDVYKQIPLFDFAVELIQTLTKKGIKLSIVSSAYEQAIKEKITKNGIDENFFFIAGMNKKGKREKIKESIRRAEVLPEESIFITDTIGDVQDAHSAGIGCIAVSWGFHTATELRTEKPEHIVHTYEDLIALL